MQVCVCPLWVCVCIHMPVCMSLVSVCMFSLWVCISVCDGMCVSIYGCVNTPVYVLVTDQKLPSLCNYTVRCNSIWWTWHWNCLWVDNCLALELLLSQVWTGDVGVLFPDSTGLGCRQCLKSAASLAAKRMSWGNLPGCLRVIDQGLVHGLGSPNSGPHRALYPLLLPPFYLLVLWFIFWPSHLMMGESREARHQKWLRLLT